LILGGGIVFIIFLVWCWKQYNYSPEYRLLKRYQTAIIKTYDLQSIPTTQGLLEHAIQLDDSHAITFARRFNAVLYGDQPLADGDIIALNLLIDAIGSSPRDK